MSSYAVRSHAEVDRRRVGGVAALYMAFALLAAIPYFLLIVDYPSAVTAPDKVDLIVGHYPSLYVIYLATYVVFGLALAAVALAVHDRLDAGRGDITTRITTTVGLTWSAALVMSGLVFTYGISTIHDLAATDLAQAVASWQAIEPVALALGSAGGELLGGLWVLLVSVVGSRSGRLPRGLTWLGIVIGLAGLISVIPVLNDATIIFGLLDIVWLSWLGVVLLRSEPTPAPDLPLPADGRITARV